MNIRNIVIIGVVLLLIVVGWTLFSNLSGQQSSSDIPNAQKDDLIWVDYPLPNHPVQSPLTITGKARGNWFFEASFPVKLFDAHNNIIAQSPARAQGSWMTTDYVPFTVTLTFPKPSTATGMIILEKDNPSGLPANANELHLPVTFP